MKAVELKNVTKKYGTRTIFEGVSFSVDEGEIVALIGPSGCGKSTILNMIGLLETHDSGTIYVFEKELPKIESRRAMMMRRETVNYLFQSFALINDMTVFQNLLLSMHFVDISQKSKIKKIDDILDAVNLLPLKNAMINTLSGGEQQRTALARTILKPGKLILADEPTGSLDANAADISFSLIQSLSKQYHKTVIMVTHSPELAQRASRIIDLNTLSETVKKSL
jgi:putative ABC transport system ATP-binding protein